MTQPCGQNLACPILVDRWRRVDVDTFVDGAEDGLGCAPPKLACDVAAEHPHAAIVLIGALVGAIRHHGIVTGIPQSQFAASQHGIDPGSPRSPLGGRLGTNGHPPAAALRNLAVNGFGENRESERHDGHQRRGDCPDMNMHARLLNLR